MIEVEHLDIRTTTLSLSLLDIAGGDAGVAERVYQRITEAGHDLVQVADEVSADLGVPIINKRIAVTPISLIVGQGNPQRFIEVANALERAAEDIGVDYVAGFSALVHKGFSVGDRAMIEVIPEAIGKT